MRFLAIAVVSAFVYTALGVHVSHAAPDALDRFGRAFAGEAPQLALVFTASCWWPTLTVLCVAALVLAARSPRWRARGIASVVTVIVMWQISDALKNVFRRPRPDYWIIMHEPTFAYSSGHAMFATIVYAAWAWYVWRSDLPRPLRRTVTPLLGLWAVGIVWSRLALGAHYITDLAGGILLGVTALAVVAAIRSAPNRARVGTEQYGD
jgi:undecaprenyl-diphosphatase